MNYFAEMTRLQNEYADAKRATFTKSDDSPESLALLNAEANYEKFRRDVSFDLRVLLVCGKYDNGAMGEIVRLVAERITDVIDFNAVSAEANNAMNMIRELRMQVENMKRDIQILQDAKIKADYEVK